jgi:two-component system, sensor histidine kinase and response regulator
MNGVMGAIELTLKSDPRPEQREYLQMAKISADSLLQVINDILDFSKVESGKLQFEAIDFNLHNTLEDALTTLSVRAEEKGLHLACKIAPEIPETVVGDPGRLRQIVLNLVGNALKFTEKGGVTVHVQQQVRTSDEVTLHFAIQDTGIGIPPERRGHIFAPFEQADGSTTRKYGGTGLGLAISAQLVDIMGGTVWVDSELGKGSTFHFTARLGVSDAPKPVALPRRLAELAGLRVLVVDEDTESSHTLAETFSDWGMTALCLNSGQAALRALKEAKQLPSASFQLIVLDCKTTEAFALAEMVKTDSAMSTPVIMMLPSACSSGTLEGCVRVRPSLACCSTCSDLDRCRALGINAHVAKPIRQAHLLDAIFVATAGLQRSDAQGQSASEVPHQIRRLTILLTEDNVINQKIAKRVLEEWGHMIEVASNGREALDKLEEKPFDLVLMDIQMPEMDGLEATRAIRDREVETGKHIPIIAITAHAMKGDRKRCLDAGMDGYISKPINTKELFDRINAVAGLVGPARSAGEDLAPSRTNGRAHTTPPAAHAPDAPALIPVRTADGTPLVLSTELLNTFADDTPLKIRELHAAVRAADSARLKHLSHYLKGSAMYIGAGKLSELCRELEYLASSGDSARLEEAVSVLQSEAERVCATVKTLRNNNGNGNGNGHAKVQLPEAS